MVPVQLFVNAMVESVEQMKLTDLQKHFVYAAFRAAIEYANAKHGMHASEEAKAAVTRG